MIKKARKRKGLTQKKLSDITGISQSYISRLERNVFIHSPTIRQVITLANALELDPISVAAYFISKEIDTMK